MSIERRDGKWLARWRDHEGRQRAKTFARKADAERHLAEQLITAPTAPTVDVGTVADLAAAWLDASPHLTETTRLTYRRNLDAYALPTLGRTDAASVTPEAVQRLLGRLSGHLAPSTVHRVYRTLRTMFGWAVGLGYMTANPCALVKPPRVPRTEIETFTVDQVEAIADAIGPRYRTLILVAAYGGLRWSELVGLRRRDVDGDAVIVAGQLQRIGGQFVRNDPKSVAGRRRVTLPASVAADLDRHLVEFTGPDPDDLVFVNQHGRPLGPSFRSNWYRACAQVGLGRRTIKNHRPAYADMPRFHDLRHTAVAFAIASGAHPKAIQQRLGHSSVAMTLDRYGHLMAGMDADLAASIDGMRPPRT